jgi:outer membrane biosynthesis protein TonB
MDVVSGPVVFRQAALDALSRWKYEPSKLDGQPVSVQMLVTIKFRR